MTNQISPLRQCMIDDMQLRNMSVLTQAAYVRAVANFSAFYGRSPDTLTAEDVRNYRLHLIQNGLAPNSLNQIVGGLRFFYKTTLDNKQIADQIPYANKKDTLPVVLTYDQVLSLFKSVTSLKHRTILILIYATGLRISEAVA